MAAAMLGLRRGLGNVRPTFASFDCQGPKRDRDVHGSLQIPRGGRMLDLIDNEEVRRIAFFMLYEQHIERITWTWDRDGEVNAHTDNSGWSVDMQDDANRKFIQDARIDVAVAGGVAEAVLLGRPHETAEQRREPIGAADVGEVRTILTQMSGTDAGWEAEIESAWTRMAARLPEPDTSRAIEGLAIALSNRRLAMFRYGFELSEPAPDRIIQTTQLDVRIERQDAVWPAAGVVQAFVPSDHEVGSVTFHYRVGDEFSHPRLELDLVAVVDEYQGTGLAYRLVEETIALHPNSVTVVSPEGINEVAGDAFIASLRMQGHLLHDQACFREGGACRCPLAL
jgi:GNAT superfamily N-acetyltransferase